MINIEIDLVKFLATFFTLIIGYYIGYFVCRWEYKKGVPKMENPPPPPPERAKQGEGQYIREFNPKPHCWGKMDWILKYPPGEEPKPYVCTCEHGALKCLKLTRENHANLHKETK